MADPFPEHLRAEYDAQLLDVKARRAKARQLQASLIDAQLWNAPRAILDVGCGAGILLASLDVPGAKRVGCDLRRELFARKAEVLFAQANVNALPFRRAQFDLVLCLAVLGEIEDWRGAVENLAQSVRPSGILYITMTNGRMLMQSYALLGMAGRRVGEAKWQYARSSRRFETAEARAGFGIPALRGWQFTDVTPHLVRARFAWTRRLPLRLLALAIVPFAPSFGFAWRRPAELVP